MAQKEYPYPENEVIKSFDSGICTHVDWEPRTNIIESGGMLVVEIELPGVKKKDVSMVLEKDREIVIRGVKPSPRRAETDQTYYLFEREFGNFYKRIVIEFPLDDTGIQSVMEDGVLTIRIPRKKTERISVPIK